MNIEVEGKVIEESESEKLLGLILNNELTWRNHLYGDNSNKGLIPQLSGRIGIMKQLSKHMSREKLQYFANGIFYSKLNYCLAVFGNVFGLDKFKEENNRYTSFTKYDNHRLQTLQNQLNRVLVNAARNTPTSELLEATNSLSIQQLIAYQTVLMAHKITKSGKPVYLHKKLQVIKSAHSLRGRNEQYQHPKYKLSLAREAFVYRASCISNKMDANVRNEPSIEAFKVSSKEWVKANILIKPAKEPSLNQRVERRNVNQNIRQPIQNQQNTIRRYFNPINHP